MESDSNIQVIAEEEDKFVDADSSDASSEFIQNSKKSKHRHMESPNAHMESSNATSDDDSSIDGGNEEDEEKLY